jgi:hypothetical protein
VPAALKLATQLELAGRIDEAVGVLTKALAAVPSMHDVRRRIQQLLQEQRFAPGALKPFQAKHLALVGLKGVCARARPGYIPLHPSFSTPRGCVWP